MRAFGNSAVQGSRSHPPRPAPLLRRGLPASINTPPTTPEPNDVPGAALTAARVRGLRLPI